MGGRIFLSYKDELNDVICRKKNDIIRDNYIKLIKLFLEK